MTHLTAQLPFFAYGTLLPGEANHDLWRAAIAAYRPAVISGAQLYDLGHFPMLTDSPTGEVRGLLVSLKPAAYAVTLRLLDQLEGSVEAFDGGGFRRWSALPASAARGPAVRRACCRGLGLSG